MRILPASTPGAVASLAAVLVAFVPFAIRYFPTWLSESSPPTTAQGFVTGALWALIGESLVRGFWLLPGCILVQLVLMRRQLHGIKVAVRVGGFASLVAAASLFPFGPCIYWPPSGADWLRRLPLAIASVLFILVWFTLYDLLSRPRSPLVHDLSAEPAAMQRRMPRRVADRAILVGALLWTTALGFLGGVFMDFGGDGGYDLVSSVRSPLGKMRADHVVYHEPGGGLGGIASEVYLLPASKPWSPRHRGLLIWRARGIHVESLVWESDQTLRVRARNSAFKSAEERSRAFTRKGFTARTEVVPGS